MCMPKRMYLWVPLTRALGDDKPLLHGNGGLRAAFSDPSKRCLAAAVCPAHQMFASYLLCACRRATGSSLPHRAIHALPPSGTDTQMTLSVLENVRELMQSFRDAGLLEHTADLLAPLPWGSAQPLRL